MQKTNRGGKISRKVILSHLHNAEGYDHDLKDENAWRVFGVAIKDIKVLHADTFRRISKSGEKDHTKVNYQWKPTVVIQAGKHTLNILDIATLWRFTNAVIHPERYSFSDFKGIIEMFLPAEFFEAIISDSNHTLSINAQRNVHDQWIVTGVEKYHKLLPNYNEIGALVRDILTEGGIALESWGYSSRETHTEYLPSPLSSRFVNNDTCLFTWGRKEIEIREFKTKFVVCARYYHTTHIIQPIEAKEVRGSLLSISADTLVVLLKKAFNALNDAEVVCLGLDSEFDHTPMTGTLKFNDRNRLEHERWLEISN